LVKRIDSFTSWLPLERERNSSDIGITTTALKNII
jgi:hypothetical protein